MNRKGIKMIKCQMKDSCSKGKECCCCECEDREKCPSVCDGADGVSNCAYAEIDGETALTLMRKEKAEVIKAVASLAAKKKEIEEQEKAMRVQLVAAMEKYGVKSLETPDVKITYIAPTTRTSIDSTKLKRDLPDVAAKYSKTSNVSASVKIEVRG